MKNNKISLIEATARTSLNDIMSLIETAERDKEIMQLSRVGKNNHQNRNRSK